jgi:hypothetical protein
MKKLIVLSVIFALVAGGLFAVDVTGTVFGHVNAIEGSTQKDAKVTSSGGMDRVRLDGSGANDDGTFGGYIRFQMNNADVGGKVVQKNSDPEAVAKDGADPTKDVEFKGNAINNLTFVDSANVWWKPIDQLKVIIGNNSDGIWGKEGVTGWGFNQMPNDSSVAINPGIWCGPWWGSSVFLPDNSGPGAAYYHNRYTFFEGKTSNALFLEVTPMDMVGINIAIPFFNGGETSDVFKAGVYQLNVNLDVGNIAITYDGDNRAGKKAGDGGAIFAYFGGSFGDLGLDVGFAYHMKGEEDTAIDQPMGIGLGLKYATDTFGVKFRTTAVLGGDLKGQIINASVLPYFTISDSLSAFVNAGLCMSLPEEGDSTTGWYFNPYLRVGEEWGPTFYFGIKVSSTGVEDGNGDKVINWAVPIALMVSF